MNYATRFRVTDNHCRVVIDAHVHTDSVVTRELNNRVIGHDRENKNGLIVLNFNNR